MTHPDPEARAMEIVPCFIKAANAFIAEHHRHHKRAHHALFALALRAMKEPSE